MTSDIFASAKVICKLVVCVVDVFYYIKIYPQLFCIAKKYHSTKGRISRY